MQAIAKRQSLPTSFYKTYKKPLLPSQEGDRVKTSKSSATTGCAVFLMASTGAAVAQTESAPIEEVIVTGIRKSIEDSIAVKKNDDQIVEVVTAEDIGKLPDSSIAESLARLPGLAAQRTNGRAQTLSIRGLGPDFTVTTFNGREQASTNDNRTVRVRSVSVGARDAGQDLQDSRCRDGLPGHCGHHGHLDGPSAGVQRTPDGGNLSS
jgi:hypothetical protein